MLCKYQPSPVQSAFGWKGPPSSGLIATHVAGKGQKASALHNRQSHNFEHEALLQMSPSQRQPRSVGPFHSTPQLNAGPRDVMKGSALVRHAVPVIRCNRGQTGGHAAGIIVSLGLPGGSRFVNLGVQAGLHKARGLRVSRRQHPSRMWEPRGPGARRQGLLVQTRK